MVRRKAYTKIKHHDRTQDGTGKEIGRHNKVRGREDVKGESVIININIANDTTTLHTTDVGGRTRWRMKEILTLALRVLDFFCFYIITN